ncbi:MAG: T9SS type A sorting domain-containing protein, partial [Chitinophagales bacterium]|nr:T9SS type A sorting domain-containing protein [Chitinophagales bacterium]
IIGGCNTKLIASAGLPIDSSVGMQLWFDTKALGSVIFATSDSVGLTSPFDSASFNPMPKAGSPALSGASFTHARLAGFENVTHRGAFGATNWMSNWASFTPNANVYKAQTSGISSNSLDAAIAVYPNPSSTFITISTDLKGQNGQLNIVDMQGRSVLNTVITSNVQNVSISQLEEGNYLVQIKDASELLIGVKHIVVKKD